MGTIDVHLSSVQAARSISTTSAAAREEAHLIAIKFLKASMQRRGSL
jgi:hypothetical protein